MFKTFAYSLMLAATFALSACDTKSEDKAQEAQQHAEKAQEKSNEAAKANADAAKAQQESKAAAAEEAKQFVPTSPAPEGPQGAPKN